MAVNLMTEAQAKVTERFHVKSVTEGIFSNEYKWDGAKSIQVYTIDAVSLANYDRTDADAVDSRFGGIVELGDTYQTYTINNDKGFEVAIDAGNAVQQKHIKKAAEVLRMITDETYVPTVDAYRLAALETGAGTKDTSQPALTSANIVEKIMTGRAAMGNAGVPMGNDVCFIGETNAVKLKIADQVVAIEAVGEKPLVNGVIGKIGGCQIRVVPDTYLSTEFMIVHKGCAWAPEQIKMMRILNEHPFVDGVVLQGRFIYDCFVNVTKNKGIYTYDT